MTCKVGFSIFFPVLKQEYKAMLSKNQFIGALYISELYFLTCNFSLISFYFMAFSVYFLSNFCKNKLKIRQKLDFFEKVLIFQKKLHVIRQKFVIIRQNLDRNWSKIRQKFERCSNTTPTTSIIWFLMDMNLPLGFYETLVAAKVLCRSYSLDRFSDLHQHFLEVHDPELELHVFLAEVLVRDAERLIKALLAKLFLLLLLLFGNLQP
jgi:hypothetical protein